MRLVLTPESVVLAEARRSYTTLSLYGYRVDGVVANRVFPAEGADDWRAGWVMAQDDVLAQVEQSFAGLPVWRSVYRSGEPVGVAALAELARDVYGADDPLAAPRGDGPFRITRTTSGAAAPALAAVRLADRGRSRAQRRRARRDRGVVSSSPHPALRAGAIPGRGRPGGAGELQVRFEERVVENAQEGTT